VPSLEKLANPTGCGVAVARTVVNLENLARRLTDELRQQYTVGFTPLKQPDGKYRRIKVVAKNPANTVRPRAGYLAKKPCRVRPPDSRGKTVDARIGPTECLPESG